MTRVEGSGCLARLARFKVECSLLAEARSRHPSPLALVSLCVALFFGTRVPLALGAAPPTGFILNYDLQSYFLPRYWFGTDELLQGRLPVWNQYELGGMPFMATTQPAVFYPPKIVFYALFSPALAHWLFLIFHFLLGALGFLLFCRELELRREAAFVGTAVYLFPSIVLTATITRCGWPATRGYPSPFSSRPASSAGVGPRPSRA